MLAGCIDVRKSDLEDDRDGIDYIATLRRGAEVFIDHKARDRGCSKFWKRGEPELALEKWSVMPSQSCIHGRTGWTLDEAKRTHYTLHTFFPEDSPKAYLLPFQLLRVTFRRHIDQWWARFHHAPQPNNGYTSECLFVPASVVLDGIRQSMTCAETNPP